MANTRAIRNRIKSVESTRQITRSMRMVAASKLRKTQEHWQQLRFFSGLSRELMQNLGDGIDTARCPLLRSPEGGRLCLVLIVGNRGLCGTYNSALIKAAGERLAAVPDGASLVVCGRWGREQIASLGVPVLRVFDKLSDDPGAGEAEEIAEYLKELFLTGGFDQIEVLHERYVSALSQEPCFLPLLPIKRESAQGNRDMIYEPDPETLLNELAELTLKNGVHSVLLEAKTSEHTARMTAMSAATDNTDELIAELSLKLNHARQAAITTEISEIVGGSQALHQNG